MTTHSSMQYNLPVCNYPLHAIINTILLLKSRDWFLCLYAINQFMQLIQYTTISTQRAQTSLAEADHYSHILPTVKMLSLGCERLPPSPSKKKKKKKKFWIITCTTIWVCYHYYGVVLLIYSPYNTQITTKI